MREIYKTIAIRKTTARILKVISAKTGMSLIDLVDSMVSQRVQELYGDDQQGLQDEVGFNEAANSSDETVRTS